MLSGCVVVVLGCFLGFGCVPYEEHWVLGLEYSYTRAPLLICWSYLRCCGRVRCGCVCMVAGGVVCEVVVWWGLVGGWSKMV